MSRILSVSRRRLLQVVGGFFLAEAAHLSAAPTAPPPSLSDRTTLAAFLDVLLPRDALAPPASELGVDVALWSVADENMQFRELLGHGCHWLNLTGGPPFAQLKPEQQVAVVEWMANATRDEAPRRFYELVRAAAVVAYYSQPEAWRGLPIERPPQPLGYPPPWQ